MNWFLVVGQAVTPQIHKSLQNRDATDDVILWYLAVGCVAAIAENETTSILTW